MLSRLFSPCSFVAAGFLAAGIALLVFGNNWGDRGLGLGLLPIAAGWFMIAWDAASNEKRRSEKRRR